MGNFIQVNDKYAIASDKNQWMIQFFKSYKDKKTGELIEKWESFKYFSTLESAVKHLGGLLLRESDCNSVAQLKTAANQIVSMLSQKFTALEIEVK